MNEDYGKLIWPAFYGPSKYYKNYVVLFSWMLHVGLIFIGVMAILMSLIQENDLLSPMFLFLGSIIVGVGLVHFLKYILKLRKDKQKNPIHWRMITNGELDWDLYENGILIKSYLEDQQKKIKDELFKFSDMSKAYVDIKKGSLGPLFELIKGYNVEHGSNEPMKLDSGWKYTIHGGIWFVGTDGKLIGYQMRKSYFNKDKDINNFKKILHERIKEVE